MPRTAAVAQDTPTKDQAVSFLRRSNELLISMLTTEQKRRFVEALMDSEAEEGKGLLVEDEEERMELGELYESLSGKLESGKGGDENKNQEEGQERIEKEKRKEGEESTQGQAGEGFEAGGATKGRRRSLRKNQV